MTQWTYSVCDNSGYYLIKHATLENALIFVEGYMNKYYADSTLHVQIIREQEENSND